MRPFTRSAICLLLLLVFAGPARAADHADPISLRQSEAGLTGLFVFPEDDRMVVILGLRPALTRSAPFEELERFRYRIHMDLDSEVRYDDRADRLRYGGTVVEPEAIRPEVTLSFRLDENAQVTERQLDGLRSEKGIRLWSGVRDDPFIQPRFFGTNVIAIALEIPFSAFPGGQKDFLIWATSSEDGEQIDHVGRANRTMLPRFDYLNTLPPHRHVEAIMERHENPGLIDDIKKVMVSPLFAARTYDFAPDVMIYHRGRSSGFPNGRRLTDDVADLTCRRGDCLLYELAFVTSGDWPKPDRNDKAFQADFPYLAEPWPDRAPPRQPSLTRRSQVLLALIGAGVLAFYLLPWVLYWRLRRRSGLRG